MKFWLGVRSLFFSEFRAAFALNIRFMLKPRPTLNYPNEKTPLSPRFLGEHAFAIPTARSAASPQARRSDLSHAGDHHRVGPSSDGVRRTSRSIAVSAR